MIRLYKASPRYQNLAEKSRYDYACNLRIIEDWAGDAPVKALDRATVQEFYQSIWQTGKHAKANAVLRVLRILLKFAWDSGHVASNAAEKPGLISTAPRLRIWTDAEIDAFVLAADAMGWPSVGDAVIYGVTLGQRQGDLLALRHIDLQADGAGWRLTLRQSKRGARVAIRLHPRAAARYTAARRRASDAGVTTPTVLYHEQTGKAWRAVTFRHIFAAVRSQAATTVPTITDAWFMDTRDTSVTNLAQAGCTVPEIAAITGHDERSVHTVLKHYLALNGTIADSAIAKLVAYDEQQKANTGTDS